jgi:hypothetical protein
LLLEHPPGSPASAEAARATSGEELTGPVLRAVGASVTRVDIDELGPDVTAARIGLTGQTHWHDYSCAAEHGIATISSAVPEPEGFALLGQAIFADDYRGATVVFRGQFRIPDAPRRAGLFLRVNTDPRRDIRWPLTEGAALADPDNTIVTIDGSSDWTSQEVTTRIPEDGDVVAFGVFLAGRGRIELRRAELIRAT